jgi:hypothetical protein
MSLLGEAGNHHAHGTEQFSGGQLDGANSRAGCAAVAHGELRVASGQTGEGKSWSRPRCSIFVYGPRNGSLHENSAHTKVVMGELPGSETRSVGVSSGKCRGWDAVGVGAHES